MEKQIAVTKISENIWQFNEPNEEGAYVDAYLVCGKEKALLVDSLQTLPDLYDKVREITSLPIDVVITHGHGDHAGESLKAFAMAGCRCYMNLQDFDNLLSFGPNGVSRDWFTDCFDKMKFELGGYCFELISVPGHTAGSLVLLDTEKGLMFSGDTIGSGAFWMQIPSALPLNRFARGLERLYEKTKNISELLIYPGHRNQSSVQLDGSYIKDVLTITRGLINGTIKGEPTVLDFHDMHMEYEQVSHGMMKSYCYNPKTIHHGAPDSAQEQIKNSIKK